MDKIEPVPALILLIGEQKPMMLPQLVSFTNLALLTTKLWHTGNHMFRLHLLALPKVDVPNLLCHRSMSDSAFFPFAYIAGPTTLVSSMNILPS